MIFSFEVVAKRREGFVQLLAADVHGHLPRDDDFLGTAFAQELILLDAVVLAHGVDDEVHGELLISIQRNLILQRVLGEFQGDGLFLDAGEGDQFIESPFQLADIGIDMAGDVVHHVFIQCEIQFFRPLLENDAADFIVRRGNRSHQAAGEAGLQAVFELVDVCRRAVTGHDDVFLLIKEVVEGVEDFHLRGVLGAEELHIVDQKEIQISIFRPELGHGAILDGVDELIGEGFTGNEKHRHVRLIGMDVIANGVEQVGLSQSRRTVDEKGIHLLVRLVRLYGALGHRVSRLEGDFVTIAMDEGVEGVFLIHRIGKEVIFLFRFGFRRRFKKRRLF